MVHSIRRRCGKTLFEESPVECDIVSTVPESAIPAAVGYAEAAGIPFDQVGAGMGGSQLYMDEEDTVAVLWHVVM